MGKLLKILIAINIVLWGLIFVAVITDHEPAEGQTQQSWLDQLTGKPIKQIKVNVCERYKDDPEMCEYWERAGINLMDKPGGLSAGARGVGNIPACDGITVDILEIKEVNGIVFYKVRYGDIVGWQTKRLLTGEE